MQLYTKKDIDLLKDRIDDIVDKIEDKTLSILEPTKKEQMEAIDIVIKYIREKKRKVYGGYAQNKLIIMKEPRDAFYKEDIIPDIDCYSPDPIVDLINISNLLHEAGFKYVVGQEAQHTETYTIFSNFVAVCDLSYVPKNIYNRIPFIEIDGINYVHPSFIMIDMYRMLTEPYFSSFRWAKSFPRIMKLQEHYPFHKAHSKLPIKKTNDNIQMLVQTLFDFTKENETTILVGQYGYNYLLHESGIMKDRNLGKKYKILNLNQIEIVSTDYKNDGKKILELLKKKHPKLFSNISIVEYYPFWSFFGYSFNIRYKDDIIGNVIHYNRRCTPYKKVKPLMFRNGKVINDKGKYIQLGSYAYILLCNMIYGFKCRVNKDKDCQHYHNIMTSHLVEMRNYYLNKNNKTLLDNTIFEEFLITCTGDTMNPGRENRLLKDKKFKQGKRGDALSFRYNPENGIREATTNYKFPNSSGNAIHNIRNLRILNVEGMDLSNRTYDRSRDDTKEQYEDEDDLLDQVKKEDKDKTEKRLYVRKLKK
jgi:hypothetical protein